MGHEYAMLMGCTRVGGPTSTEPRGWDWDGTAQWRVHVRVHCMDANQLTLGRGSRTDGSEDAFEVAHVRIDDRLSRHRRAREALEVDPPETLDKEGVPRLRRPYEPPPEVGRR